MTDFDKSVDAWQTFHQKDDPKSVLEIQGKAKNWPRKWGYAGYPETIYYRSDKWYPKNHWENYYHDHSRGVGMWHPSGMYKWLCSKKQPTVKNFPESGAVLGMFYGIDMVRCDTDEFVEVKNEKGELLCCFPNRKVLFTFSPRRGVTSLIYGPSLIVRAEGIVG